MKINLHAVLLLILLVCALVVAVLLLAAELWVQREELRAQQAEIDVLRQGQTDLRKMVQKHESQLLILRDGLNL